MGPVLGCKFGRSTLHASDRQALGGFRHQSWLVDCILGFAVLFLSNLGVFGTWVQSLRVDLVNRPCKYAANMGGF